MTFLNTISDRTNPPDGPTLHNVTETANGAGFAATLFIPGHVHSEVESFVDDLHNADFHEATAVVESFELNADRRDELTLSYDGSVAPGASGTFLADLQELARDEFADQIDPACFDEWRVQRVAVDMAGIEIRAEFPETAEETMPDDHPAFVKPPLKDADADAEADD